MGNWAAGEYAAKFDGTDDTIDLPTNVRDFFHDTSFSVSMWVKILLVLGSSQYFFSVKQGHAQALHIGRISDNFNNIPILG